MNKPSPRLIGIFVTAAMVLLVAMVMFFGTSSLLSKSTRFILFFDQSVNGLNVGSMVKYRGVPIGSVERILIRAEGQHPDSNAIPVIIKIDQTRLQKDLGVMDTVFDPDNIQDAIRRGLVAELSLESFITGQLFVEFTLDPERSPGQQWHIVGDTDAIEIPTLSSSFDEIAADVAQLVSDFSEIDIARLDENVNAAIENLIVVLAGIKSEEISDSVVQAAESVSQFLVSEEFVETLDTIGLTLEKVGETVETYNLEDGPLADTVSQWTTKLTETLDGFDALSSELSLMLEPDGSTRVELERMLHQMGRAAQSIRVLADFLERNPSALLTGRPEEGE